jgi:hypothetical protein
MTTAEDLRILVDSYTETAANLDVMLTRLNVEIASLDNEVTTLTDGVMGAAQASLDNRLEAKRAANGWQSVKTYYTSTSIESWNIWAYDNNPISGPGIFVREGDDSFSFSGLTFPSFNVGTKVKCQPGDVERTIIGKTVVATIAAWPGPDPPAAPAVPGSVTVNLDPTEAALPGGLSTVERCEVVYAYESTGWDSDAGIINDVNAFPLAYSHINDPIDLNGTYGLLARRDSIVIGRDVQILNKAKYDDFVTLYEPYAS